MVETTYLEPVSKLLTYGDCNEMERQVKDPERDRLVKEITKDGIGALSRAKIAELKALPEIDRWPNYVEELGFTQTHVPELIRLATDDELNLFSEEDLRVWAPVHAWRSLGQLQAEAAITPLIECYFGQRYTDWAMSELPRVMAMIGESAIAPLTKYLATRKNKVIGRTTASECLEKIGVQNLDLKAVCLEKLADQLAEYRRNPEELNGFLISSLVELDGSQYAQLIEAVYLSEHMDETICGTWPSVQVDLGLAKEEDFDPEELRLPTPEWAKFADREYSDKPTAFDLGIYKKGQKDEALDELSVVYGKGKLSFGKSKGKGGKSGAQKKKGFGKK